MKVHPVVGYPPEVQAYGMARYSRSAQSLEDSLAEISGQQAASFLDTYYFGYGHRSIADLAHVAFGIEGVSILAALTIEDEQLWDGQERSTRYQPFEATGWYTPPELESDARAAYDDACRTMFTGYSRLAVGLETALVGAVPCPSDMVPGAYRRAIRARAFDVARNLLPLATVTSLGQVVSARTLEAQVCRLLSDPLPEVRAVGDSLVAACREPYGEHPPILPTLVKYAAPSDYQRGVRERLEALATDLLSRAGRSDPTDGVDLIVGHGSVTSELLATLLYRHDLGGHGYRQAQAIVWQSDEAVIAPVLAAAVEGRGPHDALPREFQAGQKFAYDLLMDIGSYRDLHRHRRCTQVLQPLTPLHGAASGLDVFDQAYSRAIVDAIDPEGTLVHLYDETVRAGLLASCALFSANDTATFAPYLLPLATRCRSLFKMDLAQVLYMVDLRTGVAGHFSYRRVAWEMYRALNAYDPVLGGLARPTPIEMPTAETLLRR